MKEHGEGAPDGGPDPDRGGSNDGGPKDPLTSMLESAIQLHEVYVAYTEAGFTNEQAVYLVGVIIAAGIRGAPGGTA